MPRLGAWAAAWDALGTAAAVPTPFLRSWWLEAVARPGAVFVLVAEEGTLLGGMALETRSMFGVTVHTFCGTGTLCPDHLDMLAAAERQDAVVAALRAWFARAGSRVLDLVGVVENSLLSKAFGDGRTCAIDVAPWDLLPSDGEQYLASRSRNLRQQSRRALKRMAEIGAHHRRAGTDDLESTLADFAMLQRARGDRAELLAELPRLAGALAAGMPSGEVVVDVLETAGRTLAVSISFVVAGRLCLYQSARALDREHRDGGAVLLLEVIRQACDDGCHEMDLLRGDEEYKSRYAARTRSLYRVQVAHGAAGHALLTAMQTLERARTLAGRAVRSMRAQRALERSGRTIRRAPA